MRHLAPAVLLACLLAPGRASAEDGPALRVDGRPVALADGLQRSADGKVWITTDDLVDALGVVVRRMIPRPAEGRRALPREQRDPWMLCGPDRCSPYTGDLRGPSTEPAFDLARVVALLGHRLRVRGTVYDVQTDVPGGRERPLARVGHVVPPLALTFRDGRVRTIRDAAPKHLLLVTWASSSTSRDALEEWRAYVDMRTEQDVELWFVAVDAEGESRVKDYVAPAGPRPIALDRNADVARVFPMNDVGRWYLIDDLGVLRAEGARLDEASRAWIDLHLDEKPAERAPRPPVPEAAPDVGALRERVAAAPQSVGARLDLLDALGAAEVEEAITHARALVEAKPRSAPFAFRLARLQLDAARPGDALATLEAARRRAPGAWYLRRQYWALLEPLRYYNGPIDQAWERTQRQQEERDFGRRVR